MRLIWPWINSLFQQNIYVKSNVWSCKSAEAVKISSNFENISRILTPDKFEEKSPNCKKFRCVIRANFKKFG